MKRARLIVIVIVIVIVMEEKPKSKKKSSPLRIFIAVVIIFTGWLIIMILAGTLMANFQQPPSTEISIPGTESLDTIEKLGDSLPSATGQSGRIVFAAPEGEKLSDYKSVINKTLDDVLKVNHVIDAKSPITTDAVTANGRIGLTQVLFDVENATDITEEMSEEITHTLEQAKKDGLQAEASSTLLGQQTH